MASRIRQSSENPHVIATLFAGAGLALLGPAVDARHRCRRHRARRHAKGQAAGRVVHQAVSAARRRRAIGPGGTPTSPARTRTSNARRTPRTRSTPSWPTRTRSPRSRPSRKTGKIDDPVIKRAIDVIYLLYLEKQVDPELLKKMTALSNAVEKKFTTFRAKVDGKEMTDAEVRKVLKTSTMSERRQEVWEAAKEVGKVVEPDLKELVKLRNEAAKKLGFANYPRPAALPQRAERRRPDQAVRQARRPDARARSPRPRRRSTPSWPSNCGIKPSTT